MANKAIKRDSSSRDHRSRESAGGGKDKDPRAVDDFGSAIAAILGLATGLILSLAGPVLTILAILLILSLINTGCSALIRGVLP